MASSSLTIYLTRQIPRQSRLQRIIDQSICNFPLLSNKTKQFQFSRGLCCVNGHQNAHDISNSQNGSANLEGEKNASSGQTPLTSKEILEKLRRYGISGILSYGLLNTAYYLFTFLLVWFYVVPAPGKMGYVAAAKRFLKLMAMVWAGSQVTKLIRAAGALALAPFVDRGLSQFTVKFKFQSRGKAFAAIIAFCFGLAIAMFLIVTLLWA